MTSTPLQPHTRIMLRDLITAIVTFFAALGSYVAGHYDKISSTALALAGLAFLLWRWRKSAKSHLCNVEKCPYRHVPNEEEE